MFKINKKITVIAFAFLILSSNLAIADTTQWQTLAPDLQFSQIAIKTTFSTATLYAFRFSLKKYRLILALASDHAKGQGYRAHQFAQMTQGLIAINGGFFNQSWHPLGLRISSGQLKNPLRRISWWGVFYVRHQRAFIVPQRYFRRQKSIQFAIQSGPVLLRNRRILNLKDKMAPRSAICIDQKGRVILLVSQNGLLTTTELARRIRQPDTAGGLGCVNALNLDGGSSTQLYAKIGSFSLSLPSFAKVSDAIVVLPRYGRQKIH